MFIFPFYQKVESQNKKATYVSKFLSELFQQGFDLLTRKAIFKTHPPL